MNRYPTNELSLRKIVKCSLRLHYLTLKHTIYCILGITLVKYTAVFLMMIFPDVVAQLSFFSIGTLVVIYFFSVALLTTHYAFIDKTQSLTHVFKIVNQRLLPILTTFILYVGGIIFIFFASKLMTHALNQLYFHGSLSVTDGGGMLIVCILLMVYIALFFFSLPIAVIDKKSIKKSFYDSALLTEGNKVGVLILFFLLLTVLILLTTGTIHEYFLSMYHLDIVFDFVVLCVAIPLYINLLLLLIHDSKVQ